MDLYPLKFKPIYKQKIWGGRRIRESLGYQDAPDQCGELWAISTLENDISEVSNGFLAENNLRELIEVYMGDLVGDSVYDKFGEEFPLLIKFIDASDQLSVQVHPDNDLARERHHAYGKTEMWYILDADPNSQVVTNLKPGTNSLILKQHLQNHLESILVTETVQKGDFFLIDAGRVHATGKGILFAEIQQSSDITYRLYDYNRTDADGNPRELHVDLALDAINYNLTEPAKIRVTPTMNLFNRVVTTPYFTANLITFNKETKRDYSSLDSFVIYLCLDGACELNQESSSEKFTLTKGETLLIPAMLTEITLVPTSKQTQILEVYIEEE